MHDVHTGGGECLNLLREQHGHMNGNQVRVEQVELRQPRQRACTGFFDGLVHLVRGLMEVDRNRQVQLVIDNADPFKRAVGDTVRCVRRKHGLNELAVAQVVVQL